MEEQSWVSGSGDKDLIGLLNEINDLSGKLNQKLEELQNFEFEAEVIEGLRKNSGVAQ